MSAIWNALTDWHYWLFTLVMGIILYPIHGLVVYGDPWTWIFKPASADDITRSSGVGNDREGDK